MRTYVEYADLHEIQTARLKLLEGGATGYEVGARFTDPTGRRVVVRGIIDHTVPASNGEFRTVILIVEEDLEQH